jgi:hypothetical protein
MKIMNQEKIKVRDKFGNINDWTIYAETADTYKICADSDKRFLTEVYKCTTGYIDGVLYSVEIKNIVSTMPERYFRTEFGEFWVKNDEC